MKKNAILILIIFILMILSLCLGYYISDSKFLIFNNDEQKNNNDIEDNKNIDNNGDVLKEVTFDDVKYLYDSVTVFNESCADYYNYYYQDRELKVDDMSNDFKISLALYRAYADQKLEHGSVGPMNSDSYITEKTLNKYFYNIFSSDVSYDTNRINNGGFKAGYPFIFQNNRFYLAATGCQPEIEIYKEVIKATKNSKIVEIYEKIAYLKKDSFPSQSGEIKISIDSDSTIGNFDDINQVTVDFMKAHLDKLDTYKYTFKYIAEDGAYKFVKVEKVQ